MLLALNNNMKGFDLVLHNSRENRTKTTENRKNTTGAENTGGNELTFTSAFNTTTRQISTTTHTSTTTAYKTTITQLVTNKTTTDISTTTIDSIVHEKEKEDTSTQIGILNIILIMIILVLVIMCICLVIFLYKTNKRRLSRLLSATSINKIFLPSPCQTKQHQIGVMPAGQETIDYKDKNQDEELNNIIEDTNKELFLKYFGRTYRLSIYF